MMAADRIIRWTTAGAVLGVAAVAAVASYEHAYELVQAHGETGWIARLVPLTVDGLIYASSMVMLDCAGARCRCAWCTWTCCASSPSTAGTQTSCASSSSASSAAGVRSGCRAGT
jgi:hypothetical protein